MSIRDNSGVDFLIATFGKESNINLAGKILLSPLIVLIGVIFFVMDFLFLERKVG